MIKANELRIGNWVDGGSNGSLYYRIKASDFQNTDFRRTNPIPLTPEILEKAGFEWESGEDEGSMKIKVDAAWLSVDTEDFSFAIFDTEENYSKGKCPAFGLCPALKSLHQLQNLYLALTGTELNIQL